MPSIGAGERGTVGGLPVSDGAPWRSGCPGKRDPFGQDDGPHNGPGEETRPVSKNGVILKDSNGEKQHGLQI